MKQTSCADFSFRSSDKSRSHNASGRTITFTWKVICRYGVIARGAHPDFLVCILRAQNQKTQLTERLPQSTFRIQLLSPNGKPVSQADIKAALHALSTAHVYSAVMKRNGASAAVPPAAQARTERTANAPKGLESASQSRFCQAGVVAPPDSPDLGNSWIAVEDVLGR